MVRQAAQKAAQTARTAAQNARTAAQQFVRQVATQLNAGYQRVPTSEIEAGQDIEMGDIGTAEDTARSAQAAEASADGYAPRRNGGPRRVYVRVCIGRKTRTILVDTGRCGSNLDEVGLI